MTVGDLASAARIHPLNARRVLNDVRAAGLISEADEGYRYTPSERDAGAVDELHMMNQTRPVTLIRAVYGRSA